VVRPDQLKVDLPWSFANFSKTLEPFDFLTKQNNRQNLNQIMIGVDHPNFVVKSLVFRNLKSSKNSEIEQKKCPCGLITLIIRPYSIF
jgi:hypothetical protein